MSYLFECAFGVLSLAAVLFFGTLIFFTAVLSLPAALPLAALCAGTGAAGMALELVFLSL